MKHITAKGLHMATIQLLNFTWRSVLLILRDRREKCKRHDITQNFKTFLGMPSAACSHKTVQEIPRAAGIFTLRTNSPHIRPIQRDHTTISSTTAINALHGTVLLARKVPKSHGHLQEPQPATAAGTNVGSWVNLLLRKELPIRT